VSVCVCACVVVGVPCSEGVGVGIAAVHGCVVGMIIVSAQVTTGMVGVSSAFCVLWMPSSRHQTVQGPLCLEP
jgi:hypothetical protein